MRNALLNPSPLWLAAIVCTAISLKAHELNLGLSLLEEQDSRLQPALMLGYESESIGARIYSSGQKVAHHQRQVHILSLYPGRFTITENLAARVGVAVTRLATKNRSESEDSYNLGAMLGLGYRRGIFRIDWDTHLYLAGLNGIFLATGRQQALSFGIGVPL